MQVNNESKCTKTFVKEVNKLYGHCCNLIFKIRFLLQITRVNNNPLILKCLRLVEINDYEDNQGNCLKALEDTQFEYQLRWYIFSN